MALDLKDYDILEYIQTTGTQRINTNIQVDCYGKIEMCCTLSNDSITGQQTLWCCRQAWNEYCISAYYTKGSGFRCDYNTPASSYVAAPAVGTPFILMQDGRHYRLNGEIKITHNGDEFTPGYYSSNKLMLFCAYHTSYGDNLSSYGYLKFHWCRTYNKKGKMTGFLIPVKRKSDSVLGVYNTVTNTFLTNAGTGTFTAGAVKGVKLNYDLKGKDLMYQRCEYIQTKGGQYVNTGVKPASNTILTIDEQYTNAQNGLNGCIDSSANRCHIGYWSSQYHPGIYQAQGYYGSLNNNRNTITLNFSTKTFTLNSTNYAMSSSSTTLPNLYIFIGARNDSGTAAYYTNTQKIYNVKIYTGSTAVRNLIPVYRKADGKGGLFDTINGTFYPNQTSTNFTCVPITDIPVDSIKYLGEFVKEVKFANSTTSTTTVFKPLYRPLAHITINDSNSQYINTGLSSNGVYETTCQFGARTTRQLMGFNGNTATYWGATATTSSIGSYVEMDCSYTNAVFTTLQVINVRYTKSSTPNVYANGLFINQNPTTGFSGTYNIGRLNTGSYYCYLYVYKFLVIDTSGNTLANCIPAIRVSDNTVGLLNLANEAFYTNGGSGTFTYAEQ